MQERCFRISEQGLEPVGREQVLKVPPESTSCYWLDLREVDPPQLRSLLNELQVQPIIVEDCCKPRRFARVAHVEGQVFFEFPLLTEGTSDAAPYFSVICLSHCVVTIHRGQAYAATEQAESLLLENTHLAAHTRVGLLHQLLDHVLEDGVTAALGVRDEIDRLASRVDENSESANVRAILPLKRRAARFSSTFEEQLVCVEFLLQVDSPDLAIDERREYFRDLSGSLDHALRSINRLEDRLEQIHQHCLLLLQEKTNTRMSVLTIFSAIFLPLTLITGIYGMNFKIPETTWESAYPLTLAAMILIALAMLAFFYRRGWFS